jgi:hypothetical protein
MKAAPRTFQSCIALAGAGVDPRADMGDKGYDSKANRQCGKKGGGSRHPLWINGKIKADLRRSTTRLQSRPNRAQAVGRTLTLRATVRAVRRPDKISHPSSHSLHAAHYLVQIRLHCIMRVEMCKTLVAKCNFGFLSCRQPSTPTRD